MNHSEKILIIGLGGMGFYLARRLSQEGHEITVIESNFDVIQRSQTNLDAMIISGDAMKFSSWKLASAEKMDCVIAVTDNDAVNTMACLIADRVGIPQKIARVREIEFWSKNAILRKEDLKIDLIIRPEELAAQEIVQLLRTQAGNVLIDVDKGRLQVVAAHIKPDSVMAGLKIKELPSKYQKMNVQIVCVARDIETFIPGGDFQILVDDHVFLLVKKEEMPEVMRLAGLSDEDHQQVLIVGGGSLGTRVAELLESNFSVRLIEQDEKRAEQISYELKKTQALHGDGCDRATLIQAGLLNMDTIIAATGDNETNIMTSVLAKHLIQTKADDYHAEIGKTIAVVTREDHLVLASAMGIDLPVNKKILAANRILRYIRRGHVISVAHLHGCDAELVEFLVDPGAPITKKPLFRMDFNRRIMIGAVCRKGKWEIARGTTHLQAGDRVVCVCAEDCLGELQRLFLS